MNKIFFKKFEYIIYTHIYTEILNPPTHKIKKENINMSYQQDENIIDGFESSDEDEDG